MVRLGLLICLLLMWKFGSAQQTENLKSSGSISGKVTDSLSKENIDYATITINNADNLKTVSGATTDTSGKFSVDNLTPGKYTVVIEFIGYKKKTINNVVLSNNKSSVNIGTIILAKTSTELQSVTVTTQARLIENRIDKLVFNVEKDITSQTGVATDVLKKVPQVTVDIDGNVELSGSSSVRFLINGRPSSAFGSNIADVLQAIPANQIKSIEVITNPGAKYDAQGLGGIINIILKQDKTKGINTSISLTAGTRQENGSINFNARNGNFGINAFISGNARLVVNTNNSSTRTSIDSATSSETVLQQDGNASVTRHGIESGVGFDWALNKKNALTGSVNFDQFGTTTNGMINQLQTTTDPTGGIISNIASLSNSYNSFRFHTVDANLDYKRTFKTDEQTLEIGINTSFGKGNNTANNTQFLLPQDSLYYGVNSTNPGKQNETEITADYVQPLSKNVNLGVGGKFFARDINSSSDVLSLQPDSKIYKPDLYLSNALNYHQKLYAAYSELSFPVANWFDAKVGARYERTEIKDFFSNAQQQVKTPGYNTFVPSIFFMKKLPSNQSIKLSYSKRIERPDYGDLNPFINTSDPKNLTRGNPYLLPELGNRIELSYNRNLGSAGSFMVTAFYRTSNNDMQPYVKYYDSFQVGDTIYTNLSVSTRENIGAERNLGINLFGDITLSSKFSLRSNVFAFYRRTINAIDIGMNAESFNYRFNVNASYQFTNTLAAEFFGNFNSARNEVQGRYPSFTTYSFAIRKQFWNKKGSFALTANNIFSENIKQQTLLSGTNFILNSVRYVPFRSIGLNFTWKFGKLEFKKDQDNHNDNTTLPEG